MVKKIPAIPFLLPLIQEVMAHGTKALPQIFRHVGYELDPSEDKTRNRALANKIHPSLYKYIQRF
jgi:hypothetical protein